MSYIEVQDLSKTYPDGAGQSLKVLDSISFQIERGELVAILGPNGSGKTTLLMTMAGLLTADSGSIAIDGHPPDRTRVGLMLQNYAASLFPWLRNVDNIGFVLDGSIARVREKRARVRELVAQMGLVDLPLDRYPYQCSGGQKQLIALARELAYRPEVLLLDEPFASLDYERRLQQQRHLLAVWERTRTTVVIVSHDVDDAVFLADRIILLSQRPAVIAATIDVPLPRPRVAELQATTEYAAIRAAVLRRFLEVLRA